MTEVNEMEKELEQIQKTIAERKQTANEKRLPGMINEVVLNYGRYSEWGGGEYNYHEKGLSIHNSVHNQNYLKVNLGYETDDVFRAALLPNEVGEILLYIPGSWEDRIQELYNLIPDKKQKDQAQVIQQKITLLKEKWRLE